MRAPTAAAPTAGGARRARQALRDLGLSLTGTRIVDGSGLSSSDRTTTGLLRACSPPRRGRRRSPGRCVAALSIAGKDGTLRGVMTTGPARGVVRAKTGRLNIKLGAVRVRRAVRLQRDVNGRAVNPTAAHALQDRIARYLAREA